MSATTLIRNAESEGLRFAIDERGALKCTGPKSIAERWAPTLRQHKAEIVAELSAANDSQTPEADEFWRTLAERIAECDSLIHRLCDLRGDAPEHRAELLAVRRRMAPDRVDPDIAHLRREIARAQR